MRLIQFYLPGRGARVGLVRDGDVVDLTAPREGLTSTVAWLEASKGSPAGLRRLASPFLRRKAGGALTERALDVPPSPHRPHLRIPLEPPEVWGAGITYRRSADFRDQDAKTSIYDYVYTSDRPELFFKATAARCVGPNAPVMVRSDSRLTAAEPELAVVLGPKGRIAGFTICNDVSAWDLERENPLFLPQSKIYTGCCALGPAVVTPEEVTDPYGLEITCRIRAGGVVAWEGRTTTRDFKRRFEELVAYLLKDNAIPCGAVLATGTGIMVPNEHGLRPGHTVEIAIAGLGTLRNSVAAHR
jgi:2-dehydro-3-deoxy-D-arabinonate dehydratase